MHELFNTIRHGLIVSCQAEGDSPFNSPDGVAMFAKSAALGGAVGIRSEGILKTQRIVQSVSLPVIGLVKSSFEDGSVRITGSFKDVEELLSVGTAMVAVDGTFRKREGLTGPEFIAEIKKRFPCLVMADIATEREGIACAAAGADCVSTTLSGYTPETRTMSDEPDQALLQTLAQSLSVPVIAEGRITTPEQARRMHALGAWSIVVGSAITRPVEITRWFVHAVTTAAKN